MKPPKAKWHKMERGEFIDYEYRTESGYILGKVRHNYNPWTSPSYTYYAECWFNRRFGLWDVRSLSRKVKDVKEGQKIVEAEIKKVFETFK